ncbi:MAG: class I SAM-dependent methyltransferase [Bryobacteraceae bacterium]
MTAAAADRAVTYHFKESPYSSHSVLLGMFPAPGGGRRVLDAGCGNGDLSRILDGRGYAVTAVERPGGVTGALPESVRLVEHDLDRSLPPIEGGFDVIVLADVLEHLRDPAALLRELRPMLAADGELVVSLPNSGNLYFRLVVLSGRFPQEDKGLFDRTHLHFYTWDGWRELFGSAGFAMVEVCPTGIPVGLRFAEHSGSWPVRAAERISYELARVRKQMFAYQFIARIRPQ